MTLPARPILAAFLAALALAACTARDPARTGATGPRFASLDATLDGRTARAPVAAPRPATPVAVLPDWIGRPLRLAERDGADAFEQAVSLSLAPRGAEHENRVLVRMPRTREAADSEAAGGRPTEAGIRAELAAAFPGTPMQVVARPAANAYGPYGLAVGRTRGARCLYAWQWIEEAPPLDPTAARPAPVSLRIRLCRDDVTLEALAAAVNQLKLVPRFEGMPVTSAPVAAARPRRHRQSPVARDAQAGAPPADRGAPLARTAAPAAEPAPPPGRRYLGAIDTPAAPADPGPAALRSVFAAPGAAPAAQAGTVAATLAADLPPEALRGPAVRPPGRL